MNSQSKPKASGRPVFAPTAAQRRTVAIAAGAGTSHESIAAALGIARGTLAKHFRLELTAGAAARRLEVIAALYTAAKRGSAAAAKAYLAGDPEFVAPQAPVSTPATRKGKKEQAQEDATTAAVGTEWEDLLTPRVH